MNNLARYLTALLLLAFAAACAWRLLVGFPVVIAGAQIGQVSTFFGLVIGTGLAFALLFNRRSET